MRETRRKAHGELGEARRWLRFAFGDIDLHVDSNEFPARVCDDTETDVRSPGRSRKRFKTPKNKAEREAAPVGLPGALKPGPGGACDERAGGPRGGTENTETDVRCDSRRREPRREAPELPRLGLGGGLGHHNITSISMTEIGCRRRRVASREATRCSSRPARRWFGPPQCSWWPRHRRLSSMVTATTAAAAATAGECCQLLRTNTCRKVASNRPLLHPHPRAARARASASSRRINRLTLN